MGSNIFNLGFILGTMALIRPLPTHKLLVYRDGLILFLTTAFILVLAYFNALNRIAGVILLSALAAYLIYLGTKGKQLGLSEETDEPEATWKDYPQALGRVRGNRPGRAFSWWNPAKFIATTLGVSQWAIGMTIVAAGTSLPEMITLPDCQPQRQERHAPWEPDRESIFSISPVCWVLPACSSL